MSRSVRAWLTPLVAAATVLAVIAGVWLQSSRTAGPGGSAGSGSGGSGDVGVAAGGAPGSQGDGTSYDDEPDWILGGGVDGDDGQQGDGEAPYRGSIPTEPQSLVPLPEKPVTPKPALIGVDSYHQYDARHLALNFSNGVPGCYGTAGTPRVRETAEAVVVTIPRIPPPASDDDVACIEIALMLSVDVTLDAPLGDRVVLDGSREGAPVSAAPVAYGDGPAY